MIDPKRPSYHHGALRPALIAAAREMLDEGGQQAIGLRETARRVGVSATATYRHFKDKDSLLAAVATEGFQQFADTLRNAVGPNMSFTSVGRAYVKFALEHPGLFRLMFSPLLGQPERFPELCASADRLIALVSPSVEKSRAIPGAPPMISFIAGWAKAHGLAMLILDDALPSGVKGDEAFIDAILQRGAGPRTLSAVRDTPPATATSAS